MCIPLQAPCSSPNPPAECTLSCSTSTVQTVNGKETAIIGTTKGYWKLTTTGRNQVSFLDNPSSTLDPILSVGKSVDGNDVCNSINAKAFGSETCQADLDEGAYYIKIDSAGATSGKDSITVTCRRLLAPPALSSPNDFATLTDSTPALTWERNQQNPDDADYYRWYVRKIDETPAQAALAGRGSIISSFSSIVSQNTPLLEPKAYLWSASQGKSTSGIFSFSEYADERIFTLCGTCQSAKNMGSLNYNDAATGNTCGLSSSATNDIFKFAVSKTGYLKVDMYGPYDEFFGTPSGCDWDFWVNADGFCGSETIYIARSDATSIKCDDSATGQIFVTGDKYVKVHRNLGDGSGSINVKLLECVANNALDSACPSAKPYCSGNKCVECFSDTNCGYTAGQMVGGELVGANIKRYCDCPLAGCGRNILGNYQCTDPQSCGSKTGASEDCKPDYCCTGETPQGPGKPSKESTCVSIGEVSNPWLCI